MQVLSKVYYGKVCMMIDVVASWFWVNHKFYFLTTIIFDVSGGKVI